MGCDPSWDVLLKPYLDKPLAPIVTKAAQSVARRFSNACAVLFYGSCLRTGEVEGQLLDFYVIVDDYKGAYSSGMTAVLNRLIPPNVYYFEAEIDGVQVRSKYAVVSMGHFVQLAGEQTFNPSIWARFAQPVALAYCRDQEGRDTLTTALSSALCTMMKTTAPLAQDGSGTRDLWRSAFALTYATEFRAERGGRPGALFDLSAAFYEAVTPMALQGCRVATPSTRLKLEWAVRRVQGRGLHILRLMKAATTFDGGVDYLAWKIERHSGVTIPIKPWYRRHPVIAGLILLPRLRGRGAIR